MDDTSKYSNVSLQKLGGLNERKQFANDDLGEFDYLRGFYPFTDGSLKKMEGIKFLQQFDSPIYNICQTNDSRGNIIIQTRDAVWLMNVRDFFNLTPIPINEEEDMSHAIIINSLASGGQGGASTIALAQRPLSQILSQLNPNGSPATFVIDLTANVFRLAAGTYRIKGWAAASGSTANKHYVSLYNVTAAAYAWVGLNNQNSVVVPSAIADENIIIPFGGDLVLAADSQFELRGASSVAQTLTGFGFPNTLGVREIYTWIDILKTA
jgi:hypothetical protein